jgi:hypothetical protein
LLSLLFLSPGAACPAPIALYADAQRVTNGLLGSYVNRSLRSDALQNDWRVTQIISGRRLDPVLYFPTNGWGARAPLALTGGSDTSWDNYSVQWDGYLDVLEAGSRVATRSDDGSRLWIDLNHDGLFDSFGPEYLNNHWGSLQGATTGSSSPPLAVGFYRIRIQYEDGIGDNFMNLVVNRAYTTNATESLRRTAADASDVLWVTVNGRFVATTNGFAHWHVASGPLGVSRSAPRPRPASESLAAAG